MIHFCGQIESEFFQNHDAFVKRLFCSAPIKDMDLLNPWGRLVSYQCEKDSKYFDFGHTDKCCILNQHQQASTLTW